MSKLSNALTFVAMVLETRLLVGDHAGASYVRHRSVCKQQRCI